MYSLFYTVEPSGRFYAVKASGILCFQYMLAFHIFQHGHLLDSDLVEFVEPLLLRHALVDKDRIQI